MKALAPTLCALALSALGSLVHAGQVQITVLDKDGKPVPDAVVSVTPSAAGHPAQPLPTQATINQEKMQFLPMVSVVATGARVRFVNNDSWDHHVRGTAAGMAQFTGTTGGGFELRLDGKTEGKPPKAAEVLMDKPGPVLLGCHLHSSMRGYVFVADSAWTVKTDANGVATLDNVPDGPAQWRVWQADQLMDLPASRLTVQGAVVKAEARLSVVPRRRRI
jgi:plastocyanin